MFNVLLLRKKIGVAVPYKPLSGNTGLFLDFLECLRIPLSELSVSFFIVGDINARI